MARPDLVIADTRLPTLLSQALVAFTIEFDNQFESLRSHRTTVSRPSHNAQPGPWLVSQVMWSNFMRYIDGEGDGRSLDEIAHLAGVQNPNVPGLERWGYILVAPAPGHGPRKPPRREWLARPTKAGRRAQEVWRPLATEVEGRWRGRFGDGLIDRLRDLLSALARGTDRVMPDHMPVLRYGLWSQGSLVTRTAAAQPLPPTPGPASDSPPVPASDLSAVLASVLLAWTVEFEAASKLSLAICANILRVLGASGLPVRDLPALVGISKEATAVSVGYLERTGCAVVGPDPATGVKSARLTEKGLRAQARSIAWLDQVGRAWKERHGPEAIGALEEVLADLLTRTDDRGEVSLAKGLAPHPDGWRAKKPYLAQTERILRGPTDALPHFPMVTHRGGYPDGS